MKVLARVPPWSRVLILAILVSVVAGLSWRRTHRAPPPRLPRPAPSLDATGVVRDEREGPRAWAIAIGIDEYQDRAIPACHGAVRDAREFARWFAETAGWGPSSLLVLDELGEEKPSPSASTTRTGPAAGLLPTRANLDWAFRSWLAPRVRPDDLVVVFFAGQAIGLPPRPEAPPGSPWRHYLLPFDARSRQWEKSGWALEEALDDLASSGRNPVLCWLDTSLLGRGRRVDRDAAAAPSATPMLEALARWPGVSAWIAADGKPASEAAAVGEHSPFTTALLKALGTAERPSNIHACLDQLQRDPTLARQGFRMLGGIEPGLDLWSSRVRKLALLKRDLLLQRGHAGAVTSLAFGADGRRLISGGQDSTVKVWSASERKVLRSLSYHMVGVTGVALSPRGDRLISGDAGGWLRVWDLVNQREVFAGPPHDRGVDQLAFLPDADRFLSLDMDGKAWLWGIEAPTSQPRPLSNKATGLVPASGRGPIAFALAEMDGKIHMFDARSQRLSALDGPGGITTSRRLATDGRFLAAGDDRGGLRVWDVRDARTPVVRAFPNAIDVLAFVPPSRLAAASGRTIHLLRPEAGSGEDVQVLEIPHTANLVTASRDGRWLAAATAGGSLHLWETGASGKAIPVSLEDALTSGQATSLAIAPDGRKLVSGDRDGGLRTWELPDGHQRPRIPPRRGQVACLSVSGDGRFLLQVSQDWQAQVWDLQDGRGVSTIEGEWTSGVLSPDGSTVYLTSVEDGDVVAVDRSTGVRRATAFARPEASRLRFGKLAVSRDGRRVAAGSIDGPLACVWQAATGGLSRTIRGHLDPHPITAIGFSADARHLLTASEDGTARLWDLDDAAGRAREIANYARDVAGGGEPVPITAAALSPVAPRRVAAGGIDGRILLWEEGRKRPLDLGRLDRAVLALTFTPDGRHLAAAGADKSIWAWDMDHPRQRLRLEPAPQHAEQVNTLVAWPDGRTLASGSDDTTIRLWSLGERSLLGTLSAEQGTTDWVAYTPDGLFDSSVGGERQVSWIDNREVLSLEQVYDQFHLFKLTDQLRRGVRPKAPAPPRVSPPRVTIDPPLEPVLKDRRLTELTISLGERNLTNLRLYQDGIPIQAGDDLALAPGGRTVRVPVRLRHGVNRFHVMASRPGSTDVDGKSEAVEVRYDGPDSPAQLHVLALGVSQYDNAARRLQFADRDARQLSDFLHRRALLASGTPGLEIVLTDRDVTADRVDAAFARLRDRVKGRPEDTVAVFLAGHADAFKGRFYLLLPSFPFPEIMASTPGRTRLSPEIRGESVLPYVAIYRNLARLNALKRVVMIDACQAEAIHDDPGVRQVQELVDTGAQRARTAYLLASRRGEPAGEDSAIAHGLMTYALLKGMGDRSLETVPGVSIFDEFPTADRNRDGMVTTDELRWYAALTVPRLASNFPLLVQRSGSLGPKGPIRPVANLGQEPRIQASDTSFPLIEVPPPATAALPAPKPGK